MHSSVFLWLLPLSSGLLALACDGSSDNAEAQRSTSSSLVDGFASLRPAVPAMPAEIDIQPANGARFDRDPRGLSVTFSGFTPTAGQTVEIQVLADPNAPIAEPNWTTIGSTTTATTPTLFHDTTPIFRWATNAVPTGGAGAGVDAASSRWPSGGLLRYRTVAVDAAGNRTALPFYDASAGTCVAGLPGKGWKDVLAACKSPFSPALGAGLAGLVHAAALVSTSRDPASTGLFNPTSAPAYLSRKGFIFTNDTDRYYDAIGAPRSLGEFQERFGFSFAGGVVEATYFNASDLGIGREMHCAVFNGGTACYVRNYGVDQDKRPLFDGDPGSALDDAIARRNSFATVAMVKFGSAYSPPDGNDVQFFVFNGQDQLVNQAQLDNVQSNEAIPNNCLNCHGGTYDAAGARLVGATFLPFDPGSLLFSTRNGFTYDAQAEPLRQLNAMVKNAGPPPPVIQFVDGLYGGKPDTPGAGSAIDLDWLPAGYANDDEGKTVYREVIKPYCRTCHMSQVGDFAFMRIEDFKKQNSKTAESVCHTNDMPVAEATLGLFWRSSARAYLVNSLGLSTPCAPLGEP